MSSILYTANATAVAGREGFAETDDKAISIKLVKPGEQGGTNPEQLFACGYAACFGNAVMLVAKNFNKFAGRTEVKSSVSLNQDKFGYFISVRMNIVDPSIDDETLENIVLEAHKICPYSKLTRNNIEVALEANGKRIN